MNNFDTRLACPACLCDRHEQIYSCPLTAEPMRSFLQSFYGFQGRIDLMYLEGIDFVLDECGTCGLIYQRHVPSVALTRKLYGEWCDPERVFALDSEIQDFQYLADYAREIMMLIAFMRRKPADLAVYDYGMGWGRWIIMAQAFGCTCFGSDVAPEKALFAANHGITVIGPAEFKARRFDLINLDNIIEHVPAPLELLKELAGSLRPDGLIKVTVPDGRGIKNKLKRYTWKFSGSFSNPLSVVSPLEHINCFTRTSFDTMAKSAGLKIVKIPASLWYTYRVDWSSPKKAVKTLIFPFYERLVRKPGCLYLTSA